MPQQQSDHCPFLNRSDQRCSEFFNLDHLQHAFKFCFDRYTTCPVYAEQLGERQARRQGAVVSHGTHGTSRRVYIEVTVGGALARSSGSHIASAAAA
jgi:hypothetical protein